MSSGSRLYTVCKWGHEGFWKQDEVYFKSRKKVYKIWRCLECARINSARYRARRGPKPKEGVQKEVKETLKIRMWKLRIKRILYNIEVPY